MDPAEGHVVDESHQVRHPLGEGLKDEGSEGRGLQDHLQKHPSGDAEERDPRFGRAGRGVGCLAEQCHDRDDAAFPGVETVEEDLVAFGAGLRGPDDPFDEQRVVGARTAVTEQPLARGCLDRPRRLFDLPEKNRWQLPEHRVSAKESSAIGRVHPAPHLQGHSSAATALRSHSSPAPGYAGARGARRARAICVPRSPRCKSPPFRELGFRHGVRRSPDS